MNKNFKLLIASDTATDIDIIKAAASGLKIDLAVLSANDFSIEQVIQAQPDLLLLDEAILTGDTQPTLKLFKTMTASRHISILMLTTSNNPVQLNTLIDQGAADWLNTPLHQPLVRKRLQQQMAELARSETEQSLIRQQLKMRELGELVGLVGHEVASPIGNINTAVSFLLESTENMRAQFDEKTMASADLDKFLKRLHKALSMCTKNCANAGSIINSYRTVAGNQCLEPMKQFYLHRYLDDIVLTLKSTLKKLPHEIHIVVGESIEMTSFPGVFSQVITDLLKKSIKHGFDNKIPGTIIINAAEAKDSQGNDRVIINYIDDGKGVSQEKQAELFVADATDNKSVANRNTLTMAMLRIIVEEQLQGTMDIDSNASKGVHFILDLPRNLSGEHATNLPTNQ